MSIRGSRFLGLVLLGMALALNPDPDRTSQANGAVESNQHTDSKRNGERQNRCGSHKRAHDGYGDHRAYCGSSCDDGTRQRLVDGEVYKLRIVELGAVLSTVLTQTVVDDDGVVDRVTQQSQDNCHEVGIQRHAAEYINRVGYRNVVQKADDRDNTCGKTADLLEAECDVDSEQNERYNDRNNA